MAHLQRRVRFAGRVGGTRSLPAAGWPQIGASTVEAEWRSTSEGLGLDEQARRDFLHGNAEPVFRLEAYR